MATSVPVLKGLCSGIGLEGHEDPYLRGNNHIRLVEQNAFSDEPGIYIDGKARRAGCACPAERLKLMNERRLSFLCRLACVWRMCL